MRIIATFFALMVGGILPAAGGEAPPAPDRERSAHRTHDAAESLNPEDWPPPEGAKKLAVARPPYPRPVKQTLDFARKQCRKEGGRSIRFRPDVVRKGDLNRDGRDDYIVDFRGTACADRLYMFNGTGGWDLEIFVSRGGQLPLAFSGRVRGYDLSDGPGARIMTFDLHGGFCGKAGADECLKEKRIDGRKFAFRDR